MLEGDAHHRNPYKNRPLKTRVWIAIVMSAVLTEGTLGYSYGQILHPTGKAPSFEVATIKPSPPDSVGGRSIGPRADDRFLALRGAHGDAFVVVLRVGVAGRNEVVTKLTFVVSHDQKHGIQDANYCFKRA
jgi:hypothetical protein